jgi:hypothetical protein
MAELNPWASRVRASASPGGRRSFWVEVDGWLVIRSVQVRLGRRGEPLVVLPGPVRLRSDALKEAITRAVLAEWRRSLSAEDVLLGKQA